MEKERLTVEIEITKEQREAFEAYVDHACIDRERYLQRALERAVIDRGKNHARVRGMAAKSQHPQ